MSRKFFSIRICLYLLNLFKKKNRKFNNPKKIKFIFNFTFESHISISALKNSNFTENINKQIFFCRFYLQLSFIFKKKKSVDIIFNLISQLHISCFKDQREISIKDKIFLKERARFHFEKCSPFLSFLPMKRKIKINRNRSILYTKYFLSFFLSSRKYLPSSKSIRNFWRMVKSHHVEPPPRGRLNESWHANSLRSIRKSIVKIPSVEPSKRQKKGEMAK